MMYRGTRIGRNAGTGFFVEFCWAEESGFLVVGNLTNRMLRCRMKILR